MAAAVKIQRSVRSDCLEEDRVLIWGEERLGVICKDPSP